MIHWQRRRDDAACICETVHLLFTAGSSLVAVPPASTQCSVGDLPGKCHQGSLPSARLSMVLDGSREFSLADQIVQTLPDIGCVSCLRDIGSQQPICLQILPDNLLRITVLLRCDIQLLHEDLDGPVVRKAHNRAREGDGMMMWKEITR